MIRKTILTALLSLALLTGCSLPRATPTLTPSPIVLASPLVPLPTATLSAPAIPLPTGGLGTLAPGEATKSSTPVVAVTQVSPADFCADGKPTALIDSLKTALQTSDGPLLASLVSPAHGMEVRYYRDGRTVNYDPGHAKFLFESTFEVNWGDAPGSGLPTVGSFHDVVVPGFMKTFGQAYTLACNQFQVGGTTYTAAWPYSSVNYYSLYFPGTAANGNMDWHTVVVGMEHVNGKPYIQSIMQFEWEP